VVTSRHDERGFTLVELAVAMTIMLLVAGALLAALESGTRAEHNASTRIDEEQSVQLVLVQFTRDIRNATTLVPDTTHSQVGNQIVMSTPDGGIKWFYDKHAHVLHRELAHPGIPGAWDFKISLPGLLNTGGTVFTVFADDSTDLYRDPHPFTFQDAVICGASVEISVTSAAQPPSHPFTPTASAPLLTPRDHRGCP
jgi:prepilin-type N-terminal cleavage/methylation domain-containing protein